MILSSLQSSNLEVGELIEEYMDFFEDVYSETLEDFEHWDDTDNFYISLSELEEYDHELAGGLRENPDKHYYNAQIALEEVGDEYEDVSGAILRVTNFPEGVAIRDVRAEHVNEFVSIDGVVSKRTSVQPKLREAKVKCSKCMNTMKVEQLAEEDLKLPPSCVTDDCSGTPTHFRVLHTQSELVDFQKLLLQESPDKLRGGEKPQRIAVHLEGDLTGEITAGEKVTINGVVRTKRDNQQTAVFDSYVNGNSIEQERDDFEEVEIKPDEKERIKELANSDDIYQKLSNSIEPSINGYKTEKLAAGLQLFSGVRKPSVDGGSKIRGDFHILLVGDPGTGKSRILRFIKNAMPSAGVYASGKSTSSAGLCVGGDTVIQHENSLVKIRDLVDEHIPSTVENPTAIEQTFDTVAFDGKNSTEYKTSHIWKMPEQEAVTFTTQQGRTLTVSPQTPLLVATENGAEWIEAGEITEGEHIASPANIQSEKDAPKPIEYFTESDVTNDGSKNGKDIVVPSEFTSDLMWLIGLIFGSGSINEDEYTVQIANDNRQILQNAVNVFIDVFGKTPHIEYPRNNLPPVVRVKSEPIVNFLRNIGFTESSKKNIELDGGLALSKYRSDFIMGYFDAGSNVNVLNHPEETNSISVSSISESLINQIQLILLYEGINSQTRKSTQSGSVRELPDGREIHSKHDRFEISINGTDLVDYVDTIGFTSKEKVEQSREIANAIEHRDSTKKTVEQNSHTSVSKLKSVQSQKTAQNLRWNLVKDVSLSTEELYDLTTAQSNFIANGIVVHNTASAVKDDFSDTNQWTLKAGAMVVADKGVACIDEIDKMSKQDRSAMHESLEQQTVSVAKAGINTTLKSRCSLLAAANPKEGRFQKHLQISEQIDMEPALISRFDLIFIIKDVPEEEKDSDIAEHILTVSKRGEKVVSDKELEDREEESEPDIPLELLRKYVAYARKHCNPVLNEEAHERIKDFYVHLRNEEGVDNADAVPVTARKLEGVVRIAEASAKIRLSETVTLDDAERAINLVLDSLKEVGIDPETGELDADVLESGTSATQRDKVMTIKEVISDLEEEKDGDPVEMIEIIDECTSRGLSQDTDFGKYISRLAAKGDIYEPTDGAFKSVS